MKKNIPIFLRTVCLSALLLGAACAASAQDKAAAPGTPATPDASPDANIPFNIRIDVLMVAIPEEKFVTLLPDLLDKDKIEKAVPELLEAVKRKEMILEGWQFVVTKTGQRAVAETVTEMPGTQTSQPAYMAGGTTPVSFETRSVGQTFEVEPVLGPDGKTIDMDLSPQQVDLLKPSADPKPADPLYFTMKTTTSITLLSGQHLLIGTYKMLQPAGYVEVFIIHADAVPAGK